MDDHQKTQQEIGKLIGGQESLRQDIKELTHIMGKSMDQIVETQKDILQVQIQHQANSEKIHSIEKKLDDFIKSCDETKEEVRKNSTFRVAAMWVFVLVITPTILGLGTAIAKLVGNS